MPRLLPMAALATLIVGFARSDSSDAREAPIPLRRLCIAAPGVVLATPTDPTSPTKFRVQVVLRGSLKVGEAVTPAGLTPEMVRTFEPAAFVGKKPHLRRVLQALLFLEPSVGAGVWQVARGGVRMCGEDGTVLAPSGRQGALAVNPAGRWHALVARVKQDVAAVDQLNAYRRIGRPVRRAEAMLAWVQARKADFTAMPPGSDESPAGWDRLQLDVFDWILEAATPEDAWRAVKLYAELNQGDTPRLLTPVFSTPAGRALLTALAADEKRLLGDRARALQLLGANQTLWPTPVDRVRGAVTMNREEQETLLGRVSKLLTEKNDQYRVWLAQAIAGLSRSSAGPLSQALPSLVQAYKDSQPGAGRDEMAMTLCELMPPEKWKELTGNAPGYCACLRDLNRHEATLTFWLSLKTPGPAVFEAPNLVVEKLGLLGFVSETKRFPIEPKNLASWIAGWDGENSLVIQFDLSKFAPGSLYRVKVEGFAGRGKDKLKWTSEPKKFQLPARPANAPNRGYLYSR